MLLIFCWLELADRVRSWPVMSSPGLSEAGYNVKMSEIHGMSQRGGSVFTQVRFGKEEVYSPVIEKEKLIILWP